MYEEWCLRIHSRRIWRNQGGRGWEQERCSTWTATTVTVAGGAVVGTTFEDDAPKNLHINATASAAAALKTRAFWPEMGVHRSYPYSQGVKKVAES